MSVSKSRPHWEEGWTEVTYKYRRERDELWTGASRVRRLLNNDEGSTKKGGKCGDQARPEKSPTICPNLHHYRLPTAANDGRPGGLGLQEYYLSHTPNSTLGIVHLLITRHGEGVISFSLHWPADTSAAVWTMNRSLKKNKTLLCVSYSRALYPPRVFLQVSSQPINFFTPPFLHCCSLWYTHDDRNHKARRFFPCSDDNLLATLAAEVAGRRGSFSHPIRKLITQQSLFGGLHTKVSKGNRLQIKKTHPHPSPFFFSLN